MCSLWLGSTGGKEAGGTAKGQLWSHVLKAWDLAGCASQQHCTNAMCRQTQMHIDRDL